jgi:RHS repeat-associated protein
MPLGTILKAYTRTYKYDKLGNMLDLYHDGTIANRFHRVFKGYDAGSNPNPYSTSNLATEIAYGGTTVNYGFDACGNMVSEGSSRSFEWDYGDRMRGFSEGTTTAAYLYDAGGNRVKKVVRKSSSLKEVTVYIDGGFEYIYKLDSSNVRGEEFNEVHVMDGRSRVARVKVFGATWSGSQWDAKVYNLEDHLGNSTFSVDANSSLIYREEYFPFGETSFGSYLIKRYRFCGKERDEESGLYYYGARYYAPWSCRFVSIDPLAGSMPFATPYSYAANNPVVLVDVDGLAPGGGGVQPQATSSVERQDNTSVQSSGSVIARRVSNPNIGKIMAQKAGLKPSATPSSPQKANNLGVANTELKVTDSFAPATGNANGFKKFVGGAVEGASDRVSQIGESILTGDFVPAIVVIKGTYNSIVEDNADPLVNAVGKTLEPLDAPFAALEQGGGIVNNIIDEEWEKVGNAAGGRAVDAAAVLLTERIAKGGATEGGAPVSSPYPEGTFSVADWTGYPEGLPKPNGPFRLLEGTEYTNARNAANKANRDLHLQNPDWDGLQIHEIHPVKFNGSPTDLSNKVPLDPAVHRPYTTFWTRLQRNIENNRK